MQIFLAETETKTKETLNKKRNLFGLGLTSLIAACGDKAAGGSGGGDNGGGPGDPDTLPFKAAALTEAQANGYSADKSGGADNLTVEVKEAETAKATLNFSDGAADSANAGIYQLTPTENQYDLVISSNAIPADDFKGGIFIFWNVAGIKNETIGADSTTNQRLEIKGAKRGDNIGIHPSDFLKIGGADNKYDMVIRSKFVDKGGEGARTDEGAIYILWDIVDYAEATKTIDLNPAELGNATTGATAGSLAIYGATAIYSGTAKNEIGTYAPEFLQIGGADNNYDMVIRSHLVDRSATTAGAIYILWDIEDYHQDADKKIANKVIDLEKVGDSDDPLSDDPLRATAGSLAIYGATGRDNVGTHAPEFLQIGGADNNYDMVIRSHFVDKPTNPTTFDNQQGAIYILWDINNYYGIQGNPNNKEINLGADNNNFYATSGLLRIYGAINNDYIGSYAPEFLQIGGKDDNYDMVIRSQDVDKEGDGVANNTNEGAIYVLWDVADYYGTEASPNNKIIVLGAAVSAVSGNEYATSGLLTIYGAARQAKLGSDANNVVYGDDGNGNKILTNIDGDDANGGTKDIAFQDNSYTYVLFGDKVAEVDDTTQKVNSKTIDLAKVKAAFTGDAATGAGFFEYNNNGTLTNISDDSATTTDSKTNAIGYRFASGTGSDGEAGYKTLDAVEAAFPNPSAPLSDTDADLGVWDIA